MDQAPPLDELAARKRLIQAKMELHRAEMALYCQQAAAPLRVVQSGFSLFRNPMVRLAAAAGLGLLLVTGRPRFLRRAAGWAAPLVMPRLRGFLVRHAFSWALKGLQFVLRR